MNPSGLLVVEVALLTAFATVFAAFPRELVTEPVFIAARFEFPLLAELLAVVQDATNRSANTNPLK